MKRKIIVASSVGILGLGFVLYLVFVAGWRERIQYDLLYTLPINTKHQKLKTGDLIQISDNTWLDVTTVQDPDPASSDSFRYHLTLHADSHHRFSLNTGKISSSLSTDSATIKQALGQRIGVDSISSSELSDIEID